MKPKRVLFALLIFASSCESPGCIRLRTTAPLLDRAYPQDGTGVGSSVRVLRTLPVGEYHYTDEIIGKDFMAFKLRVAAVDGYVISSSDVTAQCAE